MEQLVVEGRLDKAKEHMPEETIYPLPDAVARRIGTNIQIGVDSI